MAQATPEFTIDSHLLPDSKSGIHSLHYRLTVGIQPRSGRLAVMDEFLERLAKGGQSAGQARIEHVDSAVVVRKKQTGKPQQEPRRENHTIVSVPAFSGEYFPEIEALRAEVSAWRTYYLDPRTAMRRPMPPSQVVDIGLTGDQLPAFLFMLKQTPEFRPRFQAVERMVRQVVSSVEAIDVELNEKRAEIELFVTQNGIRYSNRVISEGTLRVIALAAITMNPHPSRLVALEEPENGVQPRRLESITTILGHLAIDRDVQVIVNTHSPLFVSQALRLQRKHPKQVSVVHVSHDSTGSRFTPVGDPAELFLQDDRVLKLLESDEDASIQAMLMRGLLDA